MLEEFLKVAYRQERAEREERSSRARVENLSLEDLYKMAAEKLSHESTQPADGPSWLDQFKDTPLLPHAVEVERREVELEAQMAQRYAMNEELFREKDQINIEKRLLAIELAKSQEGLMDPSGAEAPPPPVEAAPPPQSAPMQEQPPKMANALMGYGAEAVQQAAAKGGAAPTPPLAQPGALKVGEAMGRTMARSDLEKKAFSGRGIGAALGGVAGLAHGLQKDEQGNRHLLRGLAEGATGAALGHAGERMVSNMGAAGGLKGGLGALRSAGAATAKDMRSDAGLLLGKLRGAPAAAPTPQPVAPSGANAGRTDYLGELHRNLKGGGTGGASAKVNPFLGPPVSGPANPFNQIDPMAQKHLADLAGAHKLGSVMAILMAAK